MSWPPSSSPTTLPVTLGPPLLAAAAAPADATSTARRRAARSCWTGECPTRPRQSPWRTCRHRHRRRDEASRPTARTVRHGATARCAEHGPWRPWECPMTTAVGLPPFAPCAPPNNINKKKNRLNTNGVSNHQRRRTWQRYAATAHEQGPPGSVKRTSSVSVSRPWVPHHRSHAPEMTSAPTAHGETDYFLSIDAAPAFSGERMVCKFDVRSPSRTRTRTGTHAHAHTNHQQTSREERTITRQLTLPSGRSGDSTTCMASGSGENSPLGESFNPRDDR